MILDIVILVGSYFVSKLEIHQFKLSWPLGFSAERSVLILIGFPFVSNGISLLQVSLFFLFSVLLTF
jgi:hypothetical protein